MSEIFKYLPPEERSLLQRAPFPEWINPMLSTLTNDRFSDPNWFYETKFDGERALTFYNGKKITIFSRNKQNLNTTYPELVEAYKHFLCDNFVVDGEIVTFVKNVTSFSRLQQRLGIKEISLKKALETPVYYYIFDILYVNGYDITKLPLRSRKLLLRKALLYTDFLRFTEGVLEEGESYYKKACKKEWEGVIAKNLEASYQSKRSRDWLKFKCHRSQELIIIGYTAPKGNREHFGALVVGYYQYGKLYYAGKVGTGFTAQMLAFLKKEMDKYVTKRPSVHNQIANFDNIKWLKPLLVAKFDFTEWTRDGKLRHPRFKGLRMDKDAKEVIIEEARCVQRQIY